MSRNVIHVCKVPIKQLNIHVSYVIRSVRNVVDQLLHVQIVHQVKNLYQDNVHYVLRIASNVMALLNVKHVTKALWQ